MSSITIRNLGPGVKERLRRLFSFAGDTVLDPFAGSGSTAVAAIRTGRNSVSVEIEQDYLNAATRRAAKEAVVRVENHNAVVIESIDRHPAAASPKTALQP